MGDLKTVGFTYGGKNYCHECWNHENGRGGDVPHAEVADGPLFLGDDAAWEECESCGRCIAEVVPGWDEIDEQTQEDLLDWYNRADPDRHDKTLLVALHREGRFEAWDCPTCGDRVYLGRPEDWSDFQGVLQVDHTSYPGDPTYYAAEIVARQCDDCRMNVPPRHD